MDKPLGVYSYIDKAAEVGDVADNTWQFHSLAHIAEFMDFMTEFKLLELLAWVAAWLVEFAEYVSEGRDASLIGDIVVDVDLLSQLLVCHEVGNGAVQVFCHLFYDWVALRVYGRVVEWLFAAFDTQESSTLLVGLRTEFRHFQQFALIRNAGSSTFFNTSVYDAGVSRISSRAVSVPAKSFRVE